MRPLLIFPVLALPLLSLAQHANEDSLFFAKMPVREFTYKGKQHQINITLPFKDIYVWDARADTTSIGFIEFEKFYRIFFRNRFSGEFTSFINTNYSLSREDTAHSLLILLKKFRMSNYVEPGEINSNNEQQWNAGMVLSAELFLQINDTYHALYKLDTIIIAESESIDDLIENAFKAILKKSENKSLSQMHIGKKAFTFSDLKDHANELTNIAILKAPVLQKGVYLNFKEFSTNNPSIKNFEVKKGQYTDELFVSENNQTYPLQNFWGYSDGDRLYIRSAANLFQLFKCGNTFNTKAIKSLNKKYHQSDRDINFISEELIGVPVIPGAIFNPNKYSGKPTAFQLDMETGELY